MPRLHAPRAKSPPRSPFIGKVTARARFAIGYVDFEKKLAWRARGQTQRRASELVHTKRRLLVGKRGSPSAKIRLLTTKGRFLNDKRRLLVTKRRLLVAKNRLLGVKSGLLSAKRVPLATRSPLLSDKSCLLGLWSCFLYDKSRLLNDKSRLLGLKVRPAGPIASARRRWSV